MSKFTGDADEGQSFAANAVAVSFLARVAKKHPELAAEIEAAKSDPSQLAEIAAWLESLNAPTNVREQATASSVSLLLLEGFTGEVTAKNGVVYHYVDGKRVAAAQHAEHVAAGGKPSPIVSNPDPKEFAGVIHQIASHVGEDADWKDATKAIDKVLKKFGGGLEAWQQLGKQFGIDPSKKSQSEMLAAIKAHIEKNGVDKAAISHVDPKAAPAAKPEPTDPHDGGGKQAQETPEPTPATLEHVQMELQQKLASGELTHVSDVVGYIVQKQSEGLNASPNDIAKSLGFPGFDAMASTYKLDGAKAAPEPDASTPAPTSGPTAAEEPATPGAKTDLAEHVQEVSHYLHMLHTDTTGDFGYHDAKAAVTSAVDWAKMNGHDPIEVLKKAGAFLDHPKSTDEAITQALSGNVPPTDVEEPAAPAAAQFEAPAIPAGVKTVASTKKGGFATFAASKEHLKANLPGAKWDSATKSWIAPGDHADKVDPKLAGTVELAGPQIDAAAAWLKSQKDKLHIGSSQDAIVALGEKYPGGMDALAKHLPFIIKKSGLNGDEFTKPAPTSQLPDVSHLSPNGTPAAETPPAVQAAAPTQPQIAADMAGVLKVTGTSKAKKAEQWKDLVAKHGIHQMEDAWKAAGLPGQMPLDLGGEASGIFKSWAAPLNAHAQGLTPTPAAPAEPNVATTAEAPTAPAVELGSPDGYKPAGFDPAAAPKVDYAGKTPQQIDPTWQVNPNPTKQAYGGVLVRTDPATGKTQVLLRKPTGNFDGYAWTWAKGKLSDSAKTHPDAQTTALAEVAEETGHKGEIIGHLPGVYKSDGSTTNAFFLMKSGGEDPSLMDTETAETKWVDLDKAHELINQTSKASGRARDLAILEAAKKKLGGGDESDPKIYEASDALTAKLNDLAEAGASPDEVASTLKQQLSEFHPHAVNAIAADLGTTGPELLQHATNYVAEHAGVPQLKNVKNLKPIGKGGTGAKVGTTASGQKVAVKDGGSAQYGQEQVGNEVAADKIYRLLGAAVPASKVEMKGGKRHKVAKWVEGTDLGEYLATATPEQAAAVKKKLQKHFVATALLGNWDVAGMTNDNIKVAADGTPFLIDNGGSFDVSASGTKKGGTEKPFTSKVEELKTLLDPHKAPQASKIFAGVTHADIKAQIGQVLAQAPKILAATPPVHQAVMKARLDYLKQYATTDGKMNGHKLTHPKHGDVWIAPQEGVQFQDNVMSSITHPAAVEYLNHVTPAEQKAITNYTGSHYASLNEALYKSPDGHTKLTGKDAANDKGLQGAFAKAAKLPEPLTSTRRLNLSGGSLDKFVKMLTWAKDNNSLMKWRNYQSTGPSWSGNVEFTIEGITEGAIDVRPVSSHSHENEILLNRGTFYKAKSITQTSSGYKVVMEQVPADEVKAKGLKFTEAEVAAGLDDESPVRQRPMTPEEIARRQAADAAQMLANLEAAMQ